ncbi:HPr family phosphocarrier protein [Mesomycoplasma moatsii]|uniref:HPr family phosphocarrier protein n=1 Tax=Mesomycoplasma moatsii TaxID=171287 RepID=UPI0003B6C9F6
MAKFTAKIIDPIGLHARPASELTKIASTFTSEIKIISNGKEGNAKSIMNIMALGIRKDNEITIEAIGSDAEEAIEKIQSELIKLKLIG